MSKRNIQIKIMVSQEENELIRKNAKACDKIPSAYIREMAMNMYVLPCDYSVVKEHTKQISAIRNVITQLVFTIKKSGCYVPLDLEYILERMKDIFKLENQFLGNILQFENELKSKLEQTVQTVVKEHLAKTTPETKKD